jgi:hypothetical protein
MVLNGIPNKLRGNDVITVANHVPETNDPLVLGDSDQQALVQTFDAVEGLTDDLELAFHGRLSLRIRYILVCISGRA